MHEKAWTNEDQLHRCNQRMQTMTYPETCMQGPRRVSKRDNERINKSQNAKRGSHKTMKDEELGGLVLDNRTFKPTADWQTHRYRANMQKSYVTWERMVPIHKHGKASIYKQIQSLPGKATMRAIQDAEHRWHDVPSHKELHERSNKPLTQRDKIPKTCYG